MIFAKVIYKKYTSLVLLKLLNKKNAIKNIATLLEFDLYDSDYFSIK